MHPKGVEGGVVSSYEIAIFHSEALNHSKNKVSVAPSTVLCVAFQTKPVKASKIVIFFFGQIDAKEYPHFPHCLWQKKI